MRPWRIASAAALEVAHKQRLARYKSFAINRLGNNGPLALGGRSALRSPDCAVAPTLALSRWPQLPRKCRFSSSVVSPRRERGLPLKTAKNQVLPVSASLRRGRAEAGGQGGECGGSSCSLHASRCSLTEAPFPSPPLEERGRERRSSFSARTPDIGAATRWNVVPNRSIENSDGPPLPNPLLQRRRGRTTRQLLAFTRCV